MRSGHDDDGDDDDDDDDDDGDDDDDDGHDRRYTICIQYFRRHKKNVYIYISCIIYKSVQNNEN